MAENQPMSNNNADRLAWTRRDFVRVAGGVVALGAYGRRGILPTFAADPVPTSTISPAAFVGSCCAGARPATTRRGESGTLPTIAARSRSYAP